MIWSIGAILEESSRPKFHNFLIEFLKGDKVTEIYKIDLLFNNELVEIPIKLNDCPNIYDICYDEKK